MTIRGRIPTAAPYLLSTVGIGMPLCWNCIVVSYMEGFAAFDTFAYSGPILRVGISGIMTLFLIVWSLAGFFLKLSDCRPWHIISASAASFFGTAILCLAVGVIHSELLVITGVILSGAGNAFLMLSWGEYLACVYTNKMSLYVATSFCFTFALTALVLAIENAAVTATVVLSLPLLSGAARLKVVANTSGAAIPRQEIIGSFFWKMLAALFFIGLLYGFVRALAPWGAEVQANKIEVALFGFVVFALVAIMPLIFSKGLYVVQLYRLALFLAVGGCVFVPLLSGGLMWVPLSAIVSGQILFQTLIWLVNPEIVIRLGSGRFMSIFGWTMAVLYGGMFVGSGIGVALPMRFESNLFIFSMALFAFGMLGFFLFVFREEDLTQAIQSRNTGDQSANTEASSKAVALVSRQCGLTTREQEVLMLLSQGRTIPYIAESLCIASSTTKTHARHIYRKIGVRDKQQLIDVIRKLEKKETNDNNSKTIIT